MTRTDGWIRPALAMAAALAVCAAPAAAQEFPGVGGVDIRVGVASPVDENAGVSFSLDADLGYLGRPSLRAILGFSYFRGGVARADMPDGSFGATGARAGIRADFSATGTVQPYVLGALTAHNVTADVDRAEVADLLDGFYMGAAVGLGTSVALDTEGRFGAVAEVRRVFANNIGHWGFEAGFRLSTRAAEPR